MVLAHNLTAMSAQRQFNIVGTSKKKSTEKLSSGYKINRAADDAAGLTISEKMRSLIRGLNQGSDNIQEGISLIQIADGAMDEICSMLHRVKELSIKANNDTNTASDREAMQKEINQIFSELDRISESAEYNTMKVLKGNPVHSWTEKVSEDKLVERELVLKSTVRELPGWLEIDNSVSNHSYAGTQDVSGIMFADEKAEDGTINKVYYGPEQPGSDIDLGDKGLYKWSGREWTPEMSDNSTAKIDFSNLSKVDSADDLYNNMFSLLGTSMGFPCGTCNETRLSVGFSGTVDGFTYYPQRLYVNVGDTSLSKCVDLANMKTFTDSNGKKVNCFDAIKDLIKTQEKDETKTDGEKLAEVRALGNEIAKQLAAKTNDMLKTTTHYDRTLYHAGDSSLLVYDYRDTDVISPDSTVSGVVKSSTSYARVPYFELMEGEINYFEEENPIRIVCSNVKDDYIDFDLPCLNYELLGLNNYNVADYSYSYTDEFKKRLEDWEKDVTKVSHSKEVMVTNVYTQFAGFKDGEPTYRSTYSSEKKTETWYEEVHNGPKPVPTGKDITSSGYNRADVSRVDNALDIVLAERSRLGAIQNRLEHTYNNNLNKAENTTAAESRIRDTDMATEVVNNTKINILEQAVTSMMAQANQSNQGVLSLLQ